MALQRTLEVSAQENRRPRLTLVQFKCKVSYKMPWKSPLLLYKLVIEDEIGHLGPDYPTRFLSESANPMVRWREIRDFSACTDGPVRSRIQKSMNPFNL